MGIIVSPTALATVYGQRPKFFIAEHSATAEGENSAYGPTLLTLVQSSSIYTGQYTFPIFLLNADNMLGEHKRREKNIIYGRLF